MDGNQRTSSEVTALRKRMKKGSKKLSGKTTSPFVRKLSLQHRRPLQPSSARGTPSLPNVNLHGQHVRSVFPTSREELHRCTMVYILRCLAERLYTAAIERKMDSRMIRSGSAFAKGLMTQADSQDHLGIGGQKLQVKDCASPTEKNTLADEWPPSEKQLEQWVSDVVGSIDCFRTILIPVSGILNDTSLLREAYRTVIDRRAGQPMSPGKIVHHFEHEFQQMQKNKSHFNLHRRKIIMSQEIQLSLDDCWTALCSSVGPHVLTPNNLYGEDAGSVEMYENLHLRLCHAFGRRHELTRQAFPEMDWAADHTVEILLGSERRTVQSFSKLSMQQGLMKIVEMVVGPYDKEKNLKALQLLYECLFVVETKVEADTGNVVLVKRKKPDPSLKSLSVVGQRRTRRPSAVPEPSPKTNLPSLTLEAHSAHIASSLCALFLKPLTFLLPRIEEEVGKSAAESGGNDKSVRSLLARNRLHLNPYVRQMLNTIWSLVDVDGDGVLNKSEYETMHAKLMLLHYSVHVPDVGSQKALRAHDWAAEVQSTDGQDHPLLHRAGFVANWFAGLSDELTRRMSALEFTHFLNWTFSQVARYDRKRKTIKWRKDVDIVRRSNVLAQYPDSQKPVADFFEQLRPLQQQQPQTLTPPVIITPAPLLKTIEADLDFSYLDQHHTREDASKRLQGLRYAVAKLKEKAKVDATTKFSTALDAYATGRRQDLPPLHAAVHAEDEENVALLLAGGVDPLVKDEAAGRTPLHLAVEWGNCRVLFLLVEAAHRKPLINLPASNGQTPLMMAAALDRPKCLQTLLDFGADPKLQDEAGMTALDHASSSMGHRGEARNRCFEILKCYQLEDEEMPLQRLPEDTADDGEGEEEASTEADCVPPGITSSFVDAVNVSPTSPTSLALPGPEPREVTDGYGGKYGNTSASLITQAKRRQSQSRSQTHLYNDASDWVKPAKFEKLQIVKEDPAQSKTTVRARSPFSNHRKEREWPQVKSGPGGMPSGRNAPAMGSPNKNVIASNFKAVPISPFSSTVMRLHEEVNQEHGVQAIENHGTPWEATVYAHSRLTPVDCHQKRSMQQQQGTYTSLSVCNVLNGLSPVQSSPDLSRASPSKNNIVAGPSKGYIDPAVREEILQERETRIREMHPSQRAILDGLNVQVMVSSLTRSMKIPRKRPSSAATLRNKPGILSRAMRSNKEETVIGRRKRPKSASRVPSSSTHLSLARGKKQEKRRCTVRPPFVRARQLVKEEDDTPGPWEMFSEGQDFRSLSLGTNAAPRQPIVIPTVFS